MRCFKISWAMYQIDYTNRFKKDLKRCSKRGLDMKKIFEVIKLLQQDGTLPVCYRPHRLVGDRAGLRRKANPYKCRYGLRKSHC